MLPLSLTLQGIYSYQDRPQTIDFTQLTAAEIFGIFGATGSGKSTILEAISYALYGRTERLSQADRMKYNMMNLRSRRLFIDFVFMAEEKTYRFTVQAKRHRKNFEEVSTPERQAFVQDQDDWRPVALDSAEEILGLSYDNFKRTIIIPQGKFEEFLQMSSTDRTRMLKEIFNLGKYELWNRTAALERKNLLALNAQETLLLQLAHVTPEALEAAREQITAAEAALSQAGRELKAVEKRLQDLNALRELFEQRARQAAAWETLQQQEPTFARRQERLQRYESCLLHFQPLLERRNELNESLERLGRIRSEKKAQFEELETRLKKSEETFRQVQGQYLQREQLRLKAEELEKVSTLKDLDDQQKAKASRIENGQIHVRTAQEKIGELKADRQQLSQKIKQMQEALPGFQTLMAIKTWLAEHAALVREDARATSGENEARTRLEALQGRKAELLQPTFLEPGQYVLPMDQLLGLLDLGRSEKEGRIQQVEQELSRLAARAQLRALAEGLQEGEPCPLCGATHHPDIQDFARMDKMVEVARAQREQLRAELKAVEQARVGLGALSENQAQRKEELARAEVALREARQALEQHEQAFIWEAYRGIPPEQLQAEVERLEAMSASLRQEERNREVLDQALAKEQENLEKFRKAVDHLKEEHDQLNVSFRAGVEGLKTIAFDDYQGMENYRLAQLADQVRREYEGLTDLYESAEALLLRQRTERDNLQGEREALEDQYQEQTQALARQVRQLNDTLEKSEFDRIEEIETVLQSALNTASERSEIARFREDLHSARQALTELESRTEGKSFDPEKLEALQSELASREARMKELNRQLGGYQQELQRLENQWQQKQAIEKERMRLEHRAENLKVMKRLFHKSGFVNYVSTIYLHNLCVAANQRFQKLTRGALSLETADGNQFLVRDFLHDGQTRSVKTLSGGQTFQAALSLALALAEQVQQFARSRQNFFFIDEGFGSQDRASLQIIFETLKALRREHRIVGVISHVEELQQEIETFLHIHNDPETGSRIRGSWE